MSDSPQDTPHRRWNPLLREWVLVSPHRTQRPWLGSIESEQIANQPSYDPGCYLCPGNLRANGEQNAHYESTFVFQNDFAALLPDVSEILSNEVSNSNAAQDGKGLLIAQPERGLCRVGCFSPRHDLSLSRMTFEQIGAVVEMWRSETLSLAAIPWIRHIQIFENRGALMGASNPHPHCQIWATQSVPDQTRKECEGFSHYESQKSACLLCDYAALEVRCRRRLVCDAGDFVAVVPYWAVWPFELIVISKSHRERLGELTKSETSSLTHIIKQIGLLYDRLFEVPFPYSMGFHQRPVNAVATSPFHLHAHYYPPLLRSASIRKFMVGYELLAEPQRDLTPEMAAERLRGSIGKVDSH